MRASAPARTGADGLQVEEVLAPAAQRVMKEVMLRVLFIPIHSILIETHGSDKGLEFDGKLEA